MGLVPSDKGRMMIGYVLELERSFLWEAIARQGWFVKTEDTNIDFSR